MFLSEFIMTDAPECSEDTDLTRVYEMIQLSPFGFVVVIDSEVHRVPIGIVSEHSICEHLLVRGRSLRGLAAGNVMDQRTKKVVYSATIEETAALLGDEQPRVILVMDDKRRFCGIVDPAAVLNAAHSRDVIEDLGTFQPRSQSTRLPGGEIPAFGWMH
ncbi:MAG: hypothetical protein ABI539_07360 [Acidobacteriota bacterium]